MHGQADGLNGVQRAVAAHQVDPIGGAGFVAEGGEIKTIAVRAAEIGQRDGGANPGALKRLQADMAQAVGDVEAQLEALRGGGAEFQGEKFVAGPIGRQVGVEFIERPTKFGGVAREDGFDRSRVGKAK